MSRRGVLDNVPSSSIAYGLSLGKRQSSIEDHGFIATSISRLKLSKTSFNRIDLCSYLPLSSIRVGTNVLTSSRLFLILDFLALASTTIRKGEEPGGQVKEQDLYI